MIPLKYTPNQEKENKFYELIVQNRNSSFLYDINEKCKRIFQGKEFKEIILLAPEDLRNLYYTLKSHPNYKQIKDEFTQINNICNKENNYIVKVLYQGMPQEAKQLIYEQAGMDVCPYCNRNFIEKLKINKSIQRMYSGTFQLDHFYPKDEFPMFAVSFYNLIPVCGTCNSIKNNTNFNIYPYLQEIKDNISFRYDLLGCDYMENSEAIKLQIVSSNEEALEDAKNLHLEEIYNKHKDIVQEIITKMKYYNPTYIKSLISSTGLLFTDENELYRLLYGGYANPDEFGKRPLSKFIKDIYLDTKSSINTFDIFSNTLNNEE